jgi:hypothetical protein
MKAFIKKVLVGLLLSLSIFQYAYAQGISVKTYIPPQATELYSLVLKETDTHMPTFTAPYYFSALMEHESCIHLKHSKCLRPNSTLSTERELGVGLGQITKAYRKDGTIRFDTLTSLRRQFPKELGELSWDNVATRPDLQIRAIVLLYREGCKTLYTVKDDFERMAMCDSIYNGGLRDLQSARRICGLTKDCDPQFWFDNTEKYCQKSKAVLYGKRSACDINITHVHDVLKIRLPKYKKAYTSYYLVD